ncbi:MAG: hypothetical protein ACE5H9_07570 [Anaerolineae bacterium]
MNILRKPSLGDLTKAELIELIRQKWGEPDTQEIADVVWHRMTAEVNALRENARHRANFTDTDNVLAMINQLDQARKLDAKATSYFHRWVLGEDEGEEPQ